MASRALAVLAALASRGSLFFYRARAFLPDIALEEWMVCVRVVCVSLCVVVPRRRGFPESVIPGGCRERKIADKKSPLRATVVGRRGLVGLGSLGLSVFREGLRIFLEDFSFVL